jgi:hypothetical protein
MNKYTAQQILENPECEEIRNTIKKLIKDYRYIDAVFYTQKHLSLSSLDQARTCVNAIMNEIAKQVKPSKLPDVHC